MSDVRFNSFSAFSAFFRMFFIFLSVKLFVPFPMRHWSVPGVAQVVEATYNVDVHEKEIVGNKEYLIFDAFL